MVAKVSVLANPTRFLSEHEPEIHRTLGRSGQPPTEMPGRHQASALPDRTNYHELETVSRLLSQVYVPITHFELQINGQTNDKCSECFPVDRCL